MPNELYTGPNPATSGGEVVPIGQGQFGIAGSYEVVEPVFAEREGSGKITAGKHGITGQRTFVVPWKNNVTGETWKDYCEQLLGKTVLLVAPNGGILVGVTFPDLFHSVDFPQLVCQELELDGEQMRPPDAKLRVTYRRAVIKAKYMPLDYSDKVDVAVQYQGIPSLKWNYVGQNARRAVVARRYHMSQDANNGALLAGTLALKVTGPLQDLSGNPAFLTIKILLQKHADIFPGLIVAWQQAVIIAARYDASVAQVPIMNAIIVNAQTTMASTSSNVVAVSAGNPQSDALIMQNMINNLVDMAFYGRDALDALLDIFNALPDNADRQQIDQIHSATSAEVDDVSQDATNSATARDRSLWIRNGLPVLDGAIPNIPVDFRDPTTWSRQILQGILETKFGVGNVEVSIRGIDLSFNLDIDVYDTTLQLELDSERMPGANVMAITTAGVPPAQMIVLVGLSDGTTVEITSAELNSQRTARAGRVWDDAGSTFSGWFILRFSRAVARDIRFRLTAPPLTSADMTYPSGRDRLASRLQADMRSRFPPVLFGNENANGFRVQHLADINVGIGETDDYQIYMPSHDGASTRTLFPLDVTITNDIGAVNARVSLSGGIAPPDPTGPKIAGDTPAGRFIQTGHYKTERHFVLGPLLPLLMSLVGCINANLFNGFNPWTLLLTGLTARKTMTMSGVSCWTMEFVFAHNPNNWNAVYRSETGQYEFVRADGGSRTGSQISVRIGDPPVSVTLPQATVLTLPDGRTVPILTRGTGITASSQLGGAPTSSSIKAIDYGFLYPVADFGIVNMFF